MHPTAERPFVDHPIADLDAASRSAAGAAERWGLPGPELLRRGMNALFVSGDVVLRVGNTTAHPRLAHELVDVLSAHGIATVAPLHGLADIIDGLAVSAWLRVDTTERPIDWTSVGAMVRRVHAVPLEAIPDGYPVPSPAAFPWWDFAGLLAELSDGLDPQARAGIEAALGRNGRWPDALERDAVVCHGDVHPGNVLMSHDGPLLIDWDLLCVAPRGWDHAMLTTYAERWGGDPSAYRAFADGYGASLEREQLTRSIGELRNVAATLMRVRAGRTDRGAAIEAGRRLRYWRGDVDAPVWHAQ